MSFKNIKKSVSYVYALFCLSLVRMKVFVCVECLLLKLKTRGGMKQGGCVICL